MQEVLPIVMKWKQFPSPWLVTSETEKKLASVWKPSLSDLCTTDLLPPGGELPALLPGVQPDDFVDTERYEHHVCHPAQQYQVYHV